MSLPPTGAPDDGAPVTPAGGQPVGRPPEGWPPSGWPGRGPATRPRPTWEPGRFHWGDLAVVVVYAGVMVFGLGFFLAAALGLVPGDPAGLSVVDAFTVNLVSYAILVVLVLAVAWRPLVASLRVFAHGAWWKVLLLPTLWLTTILVNVLILTLIGEAQTSANQAALEEMTTQVPAGPMVLMTVIGAPIVEEYLFRHLLVGKLSRYVNVWVCAVISVLTFSFLHFLGTGGDFHFVEVIPYLTLAVTITVTYILIGRSLAYSVLLHMVNNGIALAMLYLVAPLLPELPAPTQPAAVLAPLLALLA